MIPTKQTPVDDTSDSVYYESVGQGIYQSLYAANPRMYHVIGGDEKMESTVYTEYEISDSQTCRVMTIIIAFCALLVTFPCINRYQRTVIHFAVNMKIYLIVLGLTFLQLLVENAYTAV
jgi:hypothetical protein